MIPKGKQKYPSSNALQPLSPRIQTILQQGSKSTTRKKRQDETPPLREGFIATRDFNLMLLLEQWKTIVKLTCNQTINHKVPSKKITMILLQRLEPLLR